MDESKTASKSNLESFPKVTIKQGNTLHHESPRTTHANLKCFKTEERFQKGHSRQKSLPVSTDHVGTGVHRRQKSLVLTTSQQDPYLGVYTTSPGSVPNISISSPACAFTIDSRYELVKKKGDVDCDPCEPPEWGCGDFHPRYLQCCANIKVFIFICCMFSMVSAALIAGYVNSVITTIEKRFEISSSHSGLITASVEIGSLVAVLFVSYFGGSRQIPVWIGCGAFLQGIGAISFTLPHFLSRSYSSAGGLNANLTNDNNICRQHKGLEVYTVASSNCEDNTTGNFWNIFILIASQTLIGIGGAPLFTLGTTYIDNHVEKEKAPAYIAFLYALGALGPLLGFGLGALMLQYYVDYFSFDYHRIHLTPEDPRWVGAWWAGFIICGLLLIIVSLPFFGFPKSLSTEKKKLSSEKNERLLKSFNEPKVERPLTTHEQYGKDLKDLPRSLWRLLTNPVYVVTCLGICCEVSIVCGFIVFLPKYLETQFSLSKSLANVLTGGIGVPGAVVGILMGGYLCKRLQLEAKGALQLTLVVNSLFLSTCAFLFMFGCDNVRMAGATLPYFNSSGFEIFESNLTAVCNHHCDCSPNKIEPICGINGITYFSPCYAGCTQLHVSDIKQHQNYTDCACIMENVKQPEPGSHMPPPPATLATQGVCRQTECESLLPFMAMLFVMTMVVCGSQMPLLMTSLRAVNDEEKAFALGIQFVLLRLFSYIPSPIMYGTLIDSTCLLWNQKCGHNGSCLLYDIVQFRYKYVGISAVLKVVGMCFFVADWFLVTWKNKKNADLEEEDGEQMQELTQTGS